jgi:hypothetical protein
VRFRETCFAVVVVVARVRDEVLYTFFVAPLTPLRSCQTLVLANVRQAPCPLCCPLTGTLLLAAAWPLVGIREDLVEDPLLVFYIGNLPRGVPEVDECGLAEIGNSKE